MASLSITCGGLAPICNLQPSHFHQNPTILSFKKWAFLGQSQKQQSSLKKLPQVKATASPPDLVLEDVPPHLITNGGNVDVDDGIIPPKLQVPRRNALALMLSSFIILKNNYSANALPQSSVELREYIDSFDGYSFRYPKNWIPVRGAGADIFFRDPYILDENLSVDISSPSSSDYKSVEDLGSPQVAGERVLKQYLTEFMSTRLGVRRESSVCSTSSRVADDGKLYYQIEVNIKSYANSKELAVMPQDRVARLEWDRRYLSVLGVENKQLYVLRLQTPENVFLEEESDLRQILDSFRVFKVSV